MSFVGGGSYGRLRLLCGHLRSGGDHFGQHSFRGHIASDVDAVVVVVDPHAGILDATVESQSQARMLQHATSMLRGSRGGERDRSRWKPSGNDDRLRAGV